jgi:inner membrane protein
VEFTDLRMGFEPHYVFSFFVGSRQEGAIRPLVPPERAPVKRPDAGALRWVWRRMLGETD